jgi:hypothetical protein
MLIKVKMARGGYMNLEADGRVYSDSNGAGERFIECDDFELCWPGGGEVNPKNIADMGAALETYIEAVIEHDRNPY